MATATGPQQPFRHAWTDREDRPLQADGALIARLLAAPPPAPAGAATREASLAPEPVETVAVPEVVEFGDPVVRFIRLAGAGPRPHRLVSLPVDHRKGPRVIRLHEPHLERSLTERDRFDHWRRWMVASKRKELA